MSDIEALREIEEEWLANELGRAIKNLAYPVGCGAAPHDHHLKAAARALFDRYARMIELARDGVSFFSEDQSPK